MCPFYLFIYKRVLSAPRSHDTGHGTPPYVSQRISLGTCGGGVPSSHPSLGLSAFCLSFFHWARDWRALALTNNNTQKNFAKSRPWSALTQVPHGSRLSDSCEDGEALSSGCTRPPSPQASSSQSALRKMNFPRPQAKEAQTGTKFYPSSGWLGAAGVAPALFLLYSLLCFLGPRSTSAQDVNSPPFPEYPP